MEIKKMSVRLAASLCIAVIAAGGALAQNSLPAPGTGGKFRPAPIGGVQRPGWGNSGPVWGNPGPVWGNPGMGWGSSAGRPGWSVNIGIGQQNAWQNQGTETVMAVGYDVMGVLRNVPLNVQYYWTGSEYDVTVVNAWNPVAGYWMKNIGMPAYKRRIISGV